VLHAAGVDGPYALALGSQAYAELAADSEDGYSLRRRIEENLVEGSLVWAPAFRDTRSAGVRRGQRDRARART
jgi:uncharacterized linocin/CFP29 family protein